MQVIEAIAWAGYRVWDGPCLTGTRSLRAVGPMFQCSVVYRDGDRIGRHRGAIRLAETLGIDVPAEAR